MKLVSTSDDAAALLPGHATANQGRQFRLYSMVWRWHFYAGLLVSPVILLMAGTGALLIFQDRLERVLYPGLSEAEELEERRAKGIPFHREVLQWFAECTSELGVTPLSTMR